MKPLFSRTISSLLLMCCIGIHMYGAPVPPAVQATNISFANINNAFATINWTRGDGDTCVVFVKPLQSIESALPGNGVDFTANAQFGSGSQISSTGWYAVYKGIGTSVTVTGLQPGTNYRVHVVERNFNGGVASIQYLTTEAAKNPDAFTTTNQDNALYFDGSNDFIQMNNDTIAKLRKGNFTAEAWVRTYYTQYSPNATVLSNNFSSGDGTRFNLYLEYGKPRADIYQSGVSGSLISLTTNISVADDRWHHLSLVREGEYLSLYIDGVSWASNNATDTADMNLNNKLIIGAKNTEGVYSNFFDGFIDEVRLWSKALTDEELRLWKHKKASGAIADLRMSLDFRNLYNTQVNDVSTNNFIGTMSGFSALTSLYTSTALNMVIARMATNVTDIGFVAKWDSVPGQSYTIYIDTDSNFYSPSAFITSNSSFKPEMTLTPNTVYYYRVKIDTSIFYSNIIAVKTKRPLVYDYDGNGYETVVIGEQTWMRENFRGKHYSDGRPIASRVWDNQEYNAENLGRLYTWRAANDNKQLTVNQGVCPTGWHVPAREDWDTLFNYVGQPAGGKLKSIAALNYWAAPNTGATDEYNFSAIGSGRYSGVDYGINFFGQYQTSSYFNINYSYSANFYYNDDTAEISTSDTSIFYAVRCIKNFCPKPVVDLGPDTFGITSASYKLKTPKEKSGDSFSWETTATGTFDHISIDSSFYFTPQGYDQKYSLFWIKLRATNACGKSNSDTIHLTFVDSVALHKGLQAYYTFDNNAIDYGENGLNANIYGGSYASGYNSVANSSFAFGLEDTLDFSGHSVFAMDVNTTKTISMWIRPDSIPNSRIAAILAKFIPGDPSGSQYMISLSGSKLWVYGDGTDSLSSVSNITANTWTHLVVQLKSGSNQVKIYINGTLDKVGSLTFPYMATEDNLFGGMVRYYPATYYSGRIDELGFWNRSLTKEEIDSLAAGVSAVLPSKPMLSTMYDIDYEAIAVNLVDGTNFTQLGYLIYRSDNNGVSYTKIDSVLGSWSPGSYIRLDTIPQKRKEYKYYIEAFNDFGKTKSNISTIHAAWEFGGNALSLTVDSDYLKVAHNSKFDFSSTTNNYTIEAWIKPTLKSDYGSIVSKRNTSASTGYALRLGANGNNIDFDGVYTDTGTIKLNKWYHVAGVNEAGMRKIYINGVLMSTSGTARNVDYTSDPLKIGWDSTNLVKNHFTGYIDEVRIWSLARSQSELVSNMHQPIDGGFSNLELLLDMDVNPSYGNDTVTDISVNMFKAGLINISEYVAWDYSMALITPILNPPYAITQNSFTINWSGISSGTHFAEISTDSLYTNYDEVWLPYNTPYTFNSLLANQVYYVRMYNLFYAQDNDRAFSQTYLKVKTLGCTLPIANAGSDQLNLSGTQALLAANFPGGVSRMWYNLDSAANGGVFGNRTIENTQFTGQAEKSYRLVWALSNACGTDKDTVQISFACAMPVSMAGPDTIVKSGATTVLLKGIKPFAPRNEKGQWHIVSGTGGVIANDTLFNSAFTGQIDQTYKLRWRMYNACGVVNDTVEIQFKKPEVCIEPSFSYIIIDKSVSFTNTTSIGSWKMSWEFGDGKNSNVLSPVHLFDKAGTYTVKLILTDTVKGCSADSSRVLTILETQPCTASFTYKLDTATKTVEFTNLSTGTNRYYWSFGNLSTSSLQSPKHSYSNAGLYEVCIFSVDSITNCSSDYCSNVFIPSNASDTATFAMFTYSLEGDSVIFKNLSSTNADDFYWILGNGKISTSREPRIKYSVGGIYTVTLTVFDQFSGASANYALPVAVAMGQNSCSTVAEFGYVVDDAKKSVTLVNKSSGSYAKVFWNFGDGSSSNQTDPEKVYSKAGYYLVTLNVRDSAGICSDNFAAFIKVGETTCRADFDYVIDSKDITTKPKMLVKNNSVGENLSYFWNLGDGNFSNVKDTSHVYQKPGMYKVSLTISDKVTGCFDSYTNEVQVGEVKCDAMFSYFVDSLTNTVSFAKNNIGNATGLVWGFGDGKFSTSANPSHKYTKSGYYSANLNVFDAASGCIDSYEEVILVGDQGQDCEAIFIYQSNEKNNAVSFSDKSMGNIARRLWSFGDGQTDTTANPTHVYSKTGFFNVCLTVVNTNGISNISCMQVMADLSAPKCLAEFNYTINDSLKTAACNDLSLGNPDKWNWDYNKGVKTATTQNVTFKASKSGNFLVGLKISNSNLCSSKAYKLLSIGTKSDTLIAAFGFEKLDFKLKAGGYPVDLVGAGLGDQSKLRWSFGDGTTDSTTTSPSHTYSKPGLFTVCYTISDPNTGAANTYCDTLRIEGACGNELDPPTAVCKDIAIKLNVSGQAVIDAQALDNGSSDGCGLFTLSASKTSFDASNLGDNQVKLTVTDPSSNTAECMSKVTVGAYNTVQLIENVSIISTYPNPVSDELTVELDLINATRISLKLFNAQGVEVLSKSDDNLTTGLYKTTLNTSSLNGGFYMLQVTTNKGFTKTKLITKQ